VANSNARMIDRLIDLDRTTPKLVLIVGDGMNDVYVHGRLQDTCQEHCPKFIEERRVIVAGGAGNAARSLVNWKSKTMLFNGGSKPIKTRFMVDGKCVFRHDDDNYNQITLFLSRDVMPVLMNEPDAVLLSDYDKGTLTPEFIKEMSSQCRHHGIPCVADAKRNPDMYKGCIVKGNEHYWGGYPLPKLAVATYGKDRPGIGISLVGIELPPVKCINHVGAGDCFVAHLTLALAHGFTLEDSATIAHSAGRVYVQHAHNRPPRPDEISADMVQ
jgi:bifunctional ADP-heptose synthase (sugar kinase/adenylyltransferase)